LIIRLFPTEIDARVALLYFVGIDRLESWHLLYQLKVRFYHHGITTKLKAFIAVWTYFLKSALLIHARCGLQLFIRELKMSLQNDYWPSGLLLSYHNTVKDGTSFKTESSNVARLLTFNPHKSLKK
jgi:hypothetical protein